MEKIFILPLDGLNSAQEIIETIEKVLRDPKCMIDYVSHIKFNDSFHLPKNDLRTVLSAIKEIYPELNVFFDFKLPDTNGTDKNILKHYLDLMRAGDIVTVSSICSERAFNDIRTVLPSGVKIALVSVLTDTPRAECRMRRGMVPEMAILNDAINLLESMPNPFDAIVCSPAELAFLKRNLPGSIEFITPAIRDHWMDAGQQSIDRIDGIKAAVDAGASFLVVGSQLTKGNKAQGVGAAQSRMLSICQYLRSKKSKLINGDPLQTLVNLEGFYQCPKDDAGNFIGPLVAYAGTYEVEGVMKNYVGDTYFNLAVIESHPKILNYFAEILAKKIREFEKHNSIKVSCLVGIPTGGVKIAQEVGRILDIPGICLEKKVISLQTKTEKETFELIFRRNAEVIGKNDTVILFEDLCNNFDTTAKAVMAVEQTGAHLVGIACVANRSKKFPDVWKDLVVISAISVPSDQYKQEDPEVARLINGGLLSTDPKKDWRKLKGAMVY